MLKLIIVVIKLIFYMNLRKIKQNTVKQKIIFSNKRENGDGDYKWVQVLLSSDFNKLDTYK